MSIDTWYWALTLTVFGLMIGSFAGAQTWRLRWAQLKADKAENEPYDKQEYARLHALERHNSHHDRSKCLECGEQLRWYDLLPLISWVSTKGRCRYCHAAIGWFEPLVELSVAGVFVGSFLLWPHALNAPIDVALFIVWLIAVAIGAILFAYDFKWSLLPDGLNYALIGCSLVFAGISVASGYTSWPSVAGALAILVGVYGGLYYFSRWRNGSENTWVGFGDVKLSVALALFVGNWQLAFLMLFLANFIGTIIVLPLLMKGTVSRKAHIPFGPLLLAATVITALYGHEIIGWYLGLFMY